MELQGKRIAILVDKIYQEMELWYPLYRFREAGATVTLIGPQAGAIYESKLGYPATAEKAYEEVSADDFDGLIIPGGFAPDHMRRSASATALCHAMDRQGKLVAAICHAGWLLCSAHGMLKGRKATSYFSIKDDMINAGAEWSDAEVVVDRNLVTSRRPDDLPAFSRACIAVLKGSNS